MSKFGLIQHGEERVHKIPVNHGRTINSRREKYCVRHGWVDLFLTPELHWYRLHFNCDKEVETGAAVEPMDTMKAAA